MDMTVARTRTRSLPPTTEPVAETRGAQTTATTPPSGTTTTTAAAAPGARPTLQTGADARSRFTADSGAGYRAYLAQTTFDQRAHDVEPAGDGGPSATGVGTALDDLEAAQQNRDEAAGTTLPRVEHADQQVSSASEKLKQEIAATGLPLDEVNDWYAGQSEDPARRLMVAEATADLARERADEVADSFGLGPNDEGRDNKPGHDETRAARTLEGRVRDQLTAVADESVSALRAEGHSQPEALELLRGSTGITGSKVLEQREGVPNTLGMSDVEKAEVYKPIFLANASPEAKAAYDRGEPVVLGLRHDSPIFENEGRGEFDDRFVVLTKGTTGTPQVQEFDASLDPNIQYGNDLRESYEVAGPPDEPLGPYAEHHSDSRLNPFDSDTIDGWGRISSGQTIRLQEGPHGKLYPPPDGGYNVDVDIDGNGVFDDDAVKRIDNNGYQMHGSAVGHTGSGGCITVPFYQWDDFRSTVIEGQPKVDGDDRGVYLTIV
ncbi:MAG: hypothetical protein KC933_00695 [Myxococcales bacterium]|nr:hypothetical protein [Myxococcales bacterium]